MDQDAIVLVGDGNDEEFVSTDLVEVKQEKMWNEEGNTDFYVVHDDSVPEVEVNVVLIVHN